MTNGKNMNIELSVQPEWCRLLPLQQQSVLLLAGRGPDGISKDHPCKDIQRAYRGTIFVAAKHGRLLEFGEKSDNFMSLDKFGDDLIWKDVCDRYFLTVDVLPHHYHLHLLHGAQILGYKHPDSRFRNRWLAFYLHGVRDMHLRPESIDEMDKRLSDWGRLHW
jgi:hypothetical protein